MVNLATWEGEDPSSRELGEPGPMAPNFLVLCQDKEFGLEGEF